MHDIYDSNCENNAVVTLSPIRSSIKGTTGLRYSKMPRLCEKVPIMSDVLSTVKQTEYWPPHLTQPLALHAMGAGCSRITLLSTTPAVVPADGHRLLHQIGRGSATLWSHRAINYQVPLTAHCLPLRAPHTIISDNGTNFARKQVACFCAKYEITHWFF